MHGTSRSPMRNPGARAVTGNQFENRVLWAALVPLLLLLRPYEGLIQDARIYIGSALADRDPLGVGRDLMFATEGQTGFTILKPVIRALLGVATPTDLSIALAMVGILVWLGSVAVLCRNLAHGRTAWAVVVCILALPPDYGAYGTFVYGESVVTPRVFAEAAVIGAMGGLLGGRRLLPLLLLALAVALHPLMALPGLAIAAVTLAWDDRRWLVPIGAVAMAVLAAAALKLPVADRLFEPMDAAWFAILKGRSVNLFPSLWNDEAFARTATRAAAVVMAATVAPPRLRVLLWATLGVAAAGLALSALFGDRFPLLLVVQSQPWRALWPLAVLGNASIVVAGAGLWYRGPAARLTLAVLLLAWLSTSTTMLSIGLSAAAIALRIADDRGALAGVPTRIGRIAVILALGAATVDTILSAVALRSYLSAAWAQGAEPVYSEMLLAGLQRWPLVLCALAVAIRSIGDRSADRPMRLPSAMIRAASVPGLAAACMVAMVPWNSGAREGRLIDAARDTSAALRRLIGSAPGSVLWIDDYNQSWFLADRPAYFNSTQGCPILFSHRLATAWQARGRMLVGEGLARQSNLTPWAPSGDNDAELPVSRASVEAVCHAPDHPAAIVAPGRHLDAAPPGGPTGLWYPPAPVQFMSGDGAGLHWRKVDVFTVIQCGPAEAAPSATDGGRTASRREGD